MNRRRGANVIPVLTITSWVLISAFACGAGLYYVYCKNQLHSSGSQIKALEVELADLRNKDEVVRARIASLSSPNALRKRRDQDRTFLAKYTEITRDHLEVMTDRAGGEELRPVSNDQR